MRTANGLALTLTWPGRWPKSWGVEIQFVEIDWDNKIFELDSRASTWSGTA